MQYDPLSRNTVKITLSEEELKEYSLCSENISLRTVETKRNLARLLKRMKLFSGYKAERLFLEAFPRSDGGCILYVSSLAGEELSEARQSPVRQEMMCFVENMELLIRLCAGLNRQCGQSASRVYSADGGYILIMSLKKRDIDAAKRLMSEYGTVSADRIGICAAEERGRLVCGDDAVARLALLF